MDEAVADVFQTMLEQSCPVVDNAYDLHTDISARVTFSGTLEAQCVVAFPSRSAERLTCAFLGSCDGCNWDDAITADTVGELCNMIAGGWKKRLDAPAASSDLSVPSIRRGPYLDAANAGTMRVSRTYAFGNSPFVVNLTKL
jgi:chemotaxis protein CheX